MKFKLKMMTGDELFLSEQTAKALNGMSGLVFIQELGGLINLSSISTCLPEDVAKMAEANNSRAIKRARLHDGTIAVSKDGIDWRNEYSGTKIDRAYYPELGKDDLLLLE
jgi:hypothetical protein